MKTIYAYFLYDSTLSKEEYDDLKDDPRFKRHMNELYACTDKKEYAKRFEEERDMNKFVRIKYKLDDEEAKYFLNSAHPASRLRIVKYKYFPNIENNDIRNTEEKYAEVLSTLAEESSVSNMCADGILSLPQLNNADTISPFVFNDEIIEALETLEYISCWKFLRFGDTGMSLAEHDFRDKSGRYFIPDEYQDSGADYPVAQIDELQVFVNMYGEFFKDIEKI